MPFNAKHYQNEVNCSVRMQLLKVNAFVDFMGVNQQVQSLFMVNKDVLKQKLSMDGKQEKNVQLELTSIKR